jgi:PIN domain nuclease of toxin-antitoxin system
VRVLLDTHAFLWLVTDHPSLSDRARSVFLNAGNDVLVSAVTGFEIAVKYSLGKLRLTEPPRDFMENRVRHNALSRLPVTLVHTYRLAHLPYHHRDPFDRLLVAQALEEGLPMLSCDEVLSQYGVERFW